MTQDDYKLWTGEDASSYTQAEWLRIVAIASTRLASFLCLDMLPLNEQGKMPDAIQMLLANFISGVFEHQGSTGSVESKHVRNFTIQFAQTNAANAFAQLYAQYGDLIDKYTQCDLGISVEHSTINHCGDYHGGCLC